MTHHIQLKVRLVNKLIIVFILGILITSCIKNNSSKIKDDYLIVNDILKNIKKNNIDKTLILKLDNNNVSLIYTIIELQKYELDSSKIKINEFKESIGIIKGDLIMQKLKESEYNPVKNDPFLDSVFNNKHYTHLISQKCSSQWNLELIENSYLNKTNNFKTKTVQISKPVYTQDDKAALIFVNQKTTTGIYIYKKNKGSWIPYKVVATSFVQPKAEKFIRVE